jgi:putative nucleotidyltransferase with HDIG domain
MRPDDFFGLCTVESCACEVFGGTPRLVMEVRSNRGLIDCRFELHPRSGVVAVRPGSIVLMRGHYRDDEVNEDWGVLRIDALHVVASKSWADCVAAMQVVCPPKAQGALDKLSALGRHLPAPWGTLVHSVLDNHILAERFTTLPASFSHHHAFPGGLLVHSVEVAELVARSASLCHGSEKAAAIVGGLFHDIGKTKTMGRDSASRSAYDWGHHESITGEMLAKQFDWLETLDLSSANALRAILAWRPTRDAPFAPFPPAELVRNADQMSTAFDVRNRAFGSAGTASIEATRFRGSRPYLRLIQRAAPDISALGEETDAQS